MMCARSIIGASVAPRAGELRTTIGRDSIPLDLAQVVVLAARAVHRSQLERIPQSCDHRYWVHGAVHDRNLDRGAGRTIPDRGDRATRDRARWEGCECMGTSWPGASLGPGQEVGNQERAWSFVKRRRREVGTGWPGASLGPGQEVGNQERAW